MPKISILKYLKDVYGVETRKGMEKLQYQHFLDVINHSKLNLIPNQKRRIILFKVALLHDILEDVNIDPEDLFKLINIDREELVLLKTLSRRYKGKVDDPNYIEHVINDENALIVKLADRISNMKDLLSWLKNKGLTTENKKVIAKYLKENKKILKSVNEKYTHILSPKADVTHPFLYQVFILDKLNEQLKRYIKKNIKESSNDKDNKDNIDINIITTYDIAEAFGVVINLWKNSDSLKEIYPDFIQRLEKTMNYIETVNEKHGMKYIRRLLTRINFNQSNFIKANQHEIEERILDKLHILTDYKKDIPKIGLVSEIAKKLKIKRVIDVYKLLRSDDEKELEIVYNAIIEIYNKDFDTISRIIKKSAPSDSKVVIRKTRYKELERAIDKYIKIKSDVVGTDFLDLDDLLGFRVTVGSVDDVVDFMLKILKHEYVYKLSSYIGTPSPFQGINAKLSYEGRVNYELQGVVDTVQVITDIQHDILYKELIKVDNQTKDKIWLLIKIALGIIFHQSTKNKS